MNAKYTEVGGRTYYAFEEPDDALEPAISSQSAVPVMILDGTVPAFLVPKNGFWPRQFAGVAASWQQREFDWWVGFFLPLLCIYFDPFVFRTWSAGHGMMLGDYQIFVYALSAVAILGMAAWLLWGERLGWLNGPLAGLFFAAGIVSASVGIVLIPISLLGSLAVIGMLGFTPLLASIVFLRNGVRAMISAS